MQLRADLPAPPEVVKIFVNNLISEQIAVRKIAIKGMAAIFKQQKRKHKKMTIDPAQIARQFGAVPVEEKSAGQVFAPGDSWINSWMQYQSERRPNTAERWNEPR